MLWIEEISRTMMIKTTIMGICPQNPHLIYNLTQKNTYETSLNPSTQSKKLGS
jgi:hypothetical protein